MKNQTMWILGALAAGGAYWYYQDQQKKAAAAKQPQGLSASGTLSIPGLPQTGPSGSAGSFPTSLPTVPSSSASAPSMPVINVTMPNGDTVATTPVSTVPVSLGSLLNNIPSDTVAAVTTPMTLQEIQHALNLLGSSPPLAEDGIPGPKTTGAIIAFQTRMGLVADGIAGPKTQAAIQTALAAQQGQQAANSGGLSLPPGMSIGPDGSLQIGA